MATNVQVQEPDTVHKWRWKWDISEREVLPESWADNGGTDPVEGDEVRFYAVAMIVGRQFLMEVDTTTGDTVSGPHSDRIALDILYTTADGSRAFTVQMGAKADGGNTGSSASVTPPNDFSSIRAAEPASADPVPDDSASTYDRAVSKLYEV